MPPLGIIEGRFGRLWSWQDRAHVAATLAEAGYSFYHYGPKADPYLRRRWRERHPPEDKAALAAFADRCRSLGLRFGVALTPIGATHPFDSEARAALSRRVAELVALGIDDLCILFDDLRGDLPDLAQRQADVVHWCAEQAPRARLFFCPTYYSNDPVLDRVFGQRPPDYLADIGRMIDPVIQIYWTGEEVCSIEYRAGHLRGIAALLRRPATLWDNYPVNDGPRLSRHLHLRAFTGRPPGDPGLVAGHAINPAVQAHLTCLPASTLPFHYRLGADYCYADIVHRQARQLFGPVLGAMLVQDLGSLQDTGWDQLGDRRAALKQRYAAINAPAAREVVRWLDGLDLMSDAEIKTQ